MDGPTRIRTLAQLRAVVSSGTGLVITDSARAPIFHPDPEGCVHVEERSFSQKVIENDERNGSYFALPSLAEARAHWSDVSSCGSAACRDATADVAAIPADAQAGFSQESLAMLLREATGFEAVRPRLYQPVGVEAMLGGDVKSTQRIALGLRDSSLVLCSWPGELKGQAMALYETDRAVRLLRLAGTGGWSGRPSPHLAYRHSRPTQNLYLSCALSLDEYVRRWSEPGDFEYVGGNHASESVRDDLWPWLCDRGFAEPGSAGEEELAGFLERLGRRKANLRPGIEVERAWPAAEAAELGECGDLVEEIRGAVVALLAALREPLSPEATGE